MQANVLVLALALSLSACALDDAMPPTPAAAANDAAARASTQLRAHLRTIPGVADASVVVSIAPVDPFARVAPTTTAATPTAPPPAAPSPPARVAVVVATTAGADSAVIGDAAITAARAALGADVDIQVQIAPPPPTPRLASVGPFTVERGSRPALLATLVGALLLVGGLATALALTLYRRGTSPHQSSTSTTRGS